jgi:aminopeptidase N
MAGEEMDIPPMVPSQLLGTHYSSLRKASYNRPALAYYFLIDALGKEVFMKALHHYMNTWKGKHPIPFDFIRSIELVADQDLSWFFNPWLFKSAYPDLSIKKIIENGKVVIENKGGLPLPILLDITYSDQTQESVSYSSAIWSGNETAVIIELPQNKPIQLLKLGSNMVPDVNRKDNELLRID